MKIHVHDNNHVPVKANCLTEVDLGPGAVLTLHMHSGECRPCPKGHCHQGTVNLLIVDGALYLVFEGERLPSLITMAKTEPHAPVDHH